MGEPIFFLGGFYFPVKRLGLFTAFTAAALIPTTLGLDALRQTMLAAYHTGLIAAELEMAILSVMAVAFVWVSIVAIHRMEELGRRFGRLTLKEQ